MDITVDDIDLLGAVVAILFYLSAILVFAFRLGGKPKVEYWLGLFELFLTIPLVYMLSTARAYDRPTLYYIQVGLMLLWLVVELLLDYALKIDFRRTRWLVIGYVTLFFAGTGGMLGIASHAGRGWSIAAIALFLAMAVLAFVQRKATGK